MFYRNNSATIGFFLLRRHCALLLGWLHIWEIFGLPLYFRCFQYGHLALIIVINSRSLLGKF